MEFFFERFDDVLHQHTRGTPGIGYTDRLRVCLCLLGFRRAFSALALASRMVALMVAIANMRATRPPPRHMFRISLSDIVLLLKVH